MVAARKHWDSDDEPDRDTEDMTDTVQTTAAQGSHVEEPMTHREVLEALSGLLLAMFVAMLSSTVVSNALPAHRRPTCTAARPATPGSSSRPCSTMTATTPIWGKLADLFSKKLLVQTALVIYSIGSLIAGFAPNMEVLIGARVVQGLGVGGLTALVQVVIASMVTPARARPLLRLHRRGLRARHGQRPAHRRPDRRHPAGLALVLLRRPARRGRWPSSCCRRRCTCPSSSARCSIDYLGATLIVGGVSILLVWVSLAGNQFDWTSATSCAARRRSGSPSLAAAVYVEARVAVEPIIPLRLFRDRTTALATAASVMIGVAMFGVDGLPAASTSRSPAA